MGNPTRTDKIREEKIRLELIRPDSVPEQVWNDFIKLRKAKKAPLTQTALNGIEREAEEAGWTLEEAISECVTRGWQGFKAEWVCKVQQTNNRGY